MPPIKHQPSDPVAIRTGLGKSTEEIAQACGFARYTVERWERRLTTPSAVALLHYGGALGLGDDEMGALARYWEAP